MGCGQSLVASSLRPRRRELNLIVHADYARNPARVEFGAFPLIRPIDFAGHRHPPVFDRDFQPMRRDREIPIQCVQHIGLDVIALRYDRSGATPCWRATAQISLVGNWPFRSLGHFLLLRSRVAPYGMNYDRHPRRRSLQQATQLRLGGCSQASTIKHILSIYVFRQTAQLAAASSFGGWRQSVVRLEVTSPTGVVES